MYRKLYYVLLILVLAGTPLAKAMGQPLLQLSVASYEHDPRDTSCQSHKKYDTNGDQMAILKVTSTTQGDNLLSYQFEFANMRHDTEGLHDGELWLYVQRNARFVTIRRPGYATIRRYELTPAIEAGKVYRMQLSSESPKVYTQMVQFRVEPRGVPATVMVTSSKPGAQEEVFGSIDVRTGVADKILELGTYSYRVLSNDGTYHPAIGKFTLSDRRSTHIETVRLRANYAKLTLRVDADADIYVNDQLFGRRSWTGTLRAGRYNVECRQPNHRPTSQLITVTENDQRTIDLTPPLPITGTLAVTSVPTGATITIDGKNYGPTPLQITDLLTGRHTVTLSMDGYLPDSKTVEIKEDKTLQHNIDLTEKKKKPVKQHQKTTPSDTLTAFRPSGVYLSPGLRLGTATSVELCVGGYFRHFNAEASYSFALTSESVWWNYSGLNPVECFYRPMAFAVRLGYGFHVGKTLRLTPQMGFRHLFSPSNSGTELSVAIGSSQRTSASTPGAAFNATSGLLTMRADYALLSWLSVCATPEISFLLRQSDDFERVAALSSKVNGWKGGLSLRVGICAMF